MSLTLCPALVFTVSQTLYESILPLVKTQVDSQIKVRDFSRAQVSIQPAEFGSWSEARNELMVEAKRPLKAQMSAEVSNAGSEAEATAIRAKYEAAEAAIEHDIDHKPLEMHMSLAVAYNFLSK
jgi:hypothetical protein